MRALVFTPGQKDSARLQEMPEPSADRGSVLVEMCAVGVCGTDRELLAAEYGWAPPGQSDMIIGHESLGRVLEAPTDSNFKKGDLVVGIVRQADPVPCSNCAVGEWDMCRNGKYTEHGIKEVDGFCAERFRMAPENLVRVEPALGLRAVLLEPASVLAKAWEHTERIGSRAVFRPKNVVVTGAGPVGLLAALMGVQRGLSVHVFDHNTSGPKPKLVAELGAKYYSSLDDVKRDLEEKIDIVIECTGISEVIASMMQWAGPGSVVCLAGVSSRGHELCLDMGLLNRSIVLENEAIFGSVNANRRHYEAAAVALAAAPPKWLDGLITRKVPLEKWSEALEKRKEDVKVVITGAPI